MAIFGLLVGFAIGFLIIAAIFYYMQNRNEPEELPTTYVQQGQGQPAPVVYAAPPLQPMYSAAPAYAPNQVVYTQAPAYAPNQVVYTHAPAPGYGGPQGGGLGGGMSGASIAVGAAAGMAGGLLLGGMLADAGHSSGGDGGVFAGDF